MSFVAGVGVSNLDMIYTGIGRLPEEGEEVFSNDFRLCLGGGVPATIINLHRLGVPSKFATFLGKNMFSRYVEEQFKQYGVSYTNLYHGDKNPICITTSMVTERDRTFMSYREEVEFDEELQAQIFEYLKDAKIVTMHFGLYDVYKKLKEIGCTLVLDSGWDDNMSLEQYQDYLRLADYYLPNRKEALKITGKSTIEEAAKVLSDFFEDVTIKLDRDGCYHFNRLDKSSRLIHTIPVKKAVDSTGAGDAFLSGFLYGLVKGESISKCISYGNVMGSACVQEVGCLGASVREKELIELSRYNESD